MENFNDATFKTYGLIQNVDNFNSLLIVIEFNPDG